MSGRRILSNVALILRDGAKRNLSSTPVVLAKGTDPIQQLFLDKLKEYKSRSSGGKLVDPTPDIEKEWKREMLRVAKQYGGGEGVDMSKFPDFKFQDVKLDSINLEE